MEWHEAMGFDDNPLLLEPLKAEYPMRGRDEEGKELLYRIASGHMAVIEGVDGSGRTMMLKHAIDNFRGKGRVVYVNAENLDEKLNVTDLVDRRPKGMILLMDNVHLLSRENMIRIKYFYDEDRIASVVFTTLDYDKVNFTDAIRDRVGRNVIRLPKKVDEDAAQQILKDRFGRKKPLDQAEIKKLYKQAETTKEFLMKVEHACRDEAEGK